MFVPPPVVELDQCLDLFERFIHEAESGLPLLIKAGLLHVQFETIHPFLDGNGRIGRLLITLYLCDKKILRDPLLYLSLYFKERRGEYYRLLQDVRENGAWEAWLEFFLDGIAVTANQAFNAANKIHELFKIDHERIVAVNKRASASLRVHDALQLKPYITVKALVARVGMTAPTINAALAELCLIGIIEEVTGRLRGRVFCYRAYLEILNDAGLNDGTSQDAEASC